MPVESTRHPMTGMWSPTQLQKMAYGPGSVGKHLVSSLPTATSKAFIITGISLSTTTDLIRKVESLLGTAHGGTVSDIKQHAPVADIERAAGRVLSDTAIDTLVSVGGGSPCDAAKVISHRVHEKTGRWLWHITIPTTLSAAECAPQAGFTDTDGTKKSVRAPEMAPHVVIYDAEFALKTPPRLFTSTGLRALDHATELMYLPTAAEVPTRQLALSAASALFIHLPKYHKDPTSIEDITALQLAAYASLGMLGLNHAGPLGLSHVLGHSLGAPYGIPHGETSCLTLGAVVRLKAEMDKDAAVELARMLPFIGLSRTGDDRADAKAYGDAIIKLVERLGLKKPLGEYNVSRDQVKVIAKRAMGAFGKPMEGEEYERVVKLVEGLY